MDKEVRRRSAELPLFPELEVGSVPAWEVPQCGAGDGGGERGFVRPDIDALFVRLGKSAFRSRFYLNAADRAIIAAKGIDTIRQHARDIIARRLAPAVIANDGRQTPMRHGTSPVFIAQHATGCCCRGCMEKWHGIPQGRALTAEEQEYAVEVIMKWISTHC